MKKNAIRILAILLIAVMLLPSLVGCGKKGAVDKNALVVTVARLGYGDQWLYDLAKAYEAKTGTKVQVFSKIGDSGLGAIRTEMESKASETDIFFTRAGEYFKTIYKGGVNIGGTNYACEYADLTDVWNSKADSSESVTIKEKMDPAFEEFHNMDGKYYGMPWANGIMGIVRNNKVWNSLGLTDADLPLTTDEMFALADRVKAQGVAPFIYSLESEYYSTLAPLWFAQYEGSESMSYFYNGLDPVGEKSSNLYAFQGQEEALKIIDRLVDDSNGYHHRTSVSASFTDMQSTFLLDHALFCVNGTWLENEMGSGYKDVSIEYIKTPVISSIIDRLDTVSDDATLSAVIKYVDGNGELPEGVSEEDVEIVRDARNNSYIRNGFDHIALVPAYTNKLDEAKDFLRFMYSDEGMNIYYKATTGNQLPLKITSSYDSSVKLSDFRKNANDIFAENKICEYAGQEKAKVFAIGGVNRYWYNGSSNFVRALRDGKTPAEICNINNNSLKNDWSTITSKY